MLAFSSDWTTLAGWRGLKTRLNSLRYIKGRVAKPDARHHAITPATALINPITRRPLVRQLRVATHIKYVAVLACTFSGQ